MKAIIFAMITAISLSGCAVVAVGAAAVSVTSTAVGVAWDVGKAGVSGVAAVGGAAVDALSSTPSPNPTPNLVSNPKPTPIATLAPLSPSASPEPSEVEVRAFKAE